VTQKAEGKQQPYFHLEVGVEPGDDLWTHLDGAGQWPSPDPWPLTPDPCPIFPFSSLES
jgi:hypothetical protein